MDPSMIFYLAMFTLTAAIAFGAWQILRVRRAEENNEQSHLDHGE